MATEAAEKDPRKSVKYTVSGSFYNPSSTDKNGSFEETVEGEDMTEDGANTAFYKEHSKNYPHYKIGSIKKVEAEAEKDADTWAVHVKHGGNERKERVQAMSREDAIAKVKSQLTGSEKRWATVFADSEPSPRHDGETARAGRAMRTELISRACDVATRVMDRIGKRMDAEEKGVKIPMPSDPKERAEYEAAIAKRKAAGGGKFVGDK